VPTITLHTEIDAPIERCFDLSRSIDLHMQSTSETGEQAIADGTPPGRTSGLIELGETVTWRARHFGIWQRLTSRITEYEAPVYFCDEMQKGAFKSIRHEHRFRQEGGRTLMTDIFRFESPLGFLGHMFNRLVLTHYMEGFLRRRNQLIKEVAEMDEWKDLLMDERKNKV
jgi:ligand-binding SRPBCC domain-containing protein